MDAPLLLKNTGTCLILCDANGEPLPGQLSLSISNDGLMPAVTVTFALDNERVRLCGEEWSRKSRVSSRLAGTWWPAHAGKDKSDGRMHLLQQDARMGEEVGAGCRRAGGLCYGQ